MAKANIHLIKSRAQPITIIQSIIMCTRGVFQLQKLSIFFCDFGGSSSGVRQALTSPELNQFIAENPQIEYQFICKRNHHPFIAGAFINGYLKQLPLRSLSASEVIQKMQDLRRQLGRHSYQVSGKRVYSPVRSVQGLWEPNLFNRYPSAELQTTHSISRTIMTYSEKPVIDRRFRKPLDTANKLLRIDDYREGKEQ